MDLIKPGEIIRYPPQQGKAGMKEMAERIRRLEIEIFGQWFEVKANNDEPDTGDDTTSDS